MRRPSRTRASFTAALIESLVLDVLLDRIGVVEAQMAGAAVLGGEPEIEADRLGVTDMQSTVGLRWKASDHSPAVLCARRSSAMI